MNAADLSNLMSIFADPIARRYYPSTKGEGDAEKWISWNQSNDREYGHALWMCERKEDGVFFGQCGIVPQIVNGVTEKEVGYLFARAHWGQGYAIKAACADYGLTADVAPPNFDDL